MPGLVDESLRIGARYTNRTQCINDITTTAPQLTVSGVANTPRAAEILGDVLCRLMLNRPLIAIADAKGFFFGIT